MVVVGAADGDATGFEMSTAGMTFDRMLSVVTLNVLTVPAVAHVNEVILQIYCTIYLHVAVLLSYNSSHPRASSVRQSYHTECTAAPQSWS